MNETINQRIAKHRKLANLTQAEVAEKLGMKSSTYSQMERRGHISSDKLLDLAEVFQVSPVVLLSEPDSNDYIKNFAYAEQPRDINLFHQTLPDYSYRNAFIPTRQEESMILMYRNFSKANRARVTEFIQQIYDEEKR